jgi:hypothetical protein
MIYYTIYKVTNKINGKIYIGSHKTKDLNDNYMGSGKYLNYAFNKHGIENFTKEILYVFDTPELMYAKEAELVNKEFIAESNTYNLKVGGFGGFDYINSTPELVAKRDKYEHKLAGRLAANKVIKEKYGPNYAKEHLEKIGKIGSQKFKEKYKHDEEFRKEHLKKTKKANLLSQSLEAKSKRKETMKLNNHGKGEKNSQYGTQWIHNPLEKISKKIKKNELLPVGWSKGRKLKFD